MSNFEILTKNIKIYREREEYRIHLYEKKKNPQERVLKRSG